MWRPFTVTKGSILKFNYAVEGCRAYVAFAGGIDVPEVMGSKSTYIRAGIGGFQGRALQKGDVFSCGEMKENSWSLTSEMEDPLPWAVNYHIAPQSATNADHSCSEREQSLSISMKRVSIRFLTFPIH